MSRTRSALITIVLLAFAADASAQFPVIGLPTIGQGGIAFQAGGRNLSVAGFVPLGPPYSAVVPVTPTPFGFKQIGPAYLPYAYGYYPPLAPGFPLPGYGAIDRRITVQIVNPQSVAVQGRRVASREPDLSGIDLDVESAEKIWGKKPEVAKAAPRKNPEAVKAPPEKKQQVAAPAKPPVPPPPAPKWEAVPEGQQFVERGIVAFKNGDYGVAILRFRQASECNPPGPRSLFLQGHACIAAGKYNEAVRLIQKGLRGQPDWPLSPFRPKIELYDNVDLWNEHRAAVEKANQLDPNNADYLFLLGYLEWFGGDRETATKYFQQARAMAADVRWSDVFLKSAKK